MKVLVLDLTHGGDILALEYARKGHWATAVDIYHTAPSVMCKDLRSKGVDVRESAPDETFDLGVAPIHCPERFFGTARCARKITHHQAVGELASFRFPIVEVTGARGKTTTCHLIARILADQGKRVLLLTSGGLSMVGPNGATVLKGKVSIAPPTILTLVGKNYDVDVGVFEISLGGTGLASVSVVTNIGDDYAIAQNTRRAFDGKVQMVRFARGAVVYPEEERKLWEPHVDRAAESITFGKCSDVEALLSDLELGTSAKLTVRTGVNVSRTNLHPNYLAPSYMTAFGAAAAAAYAMGVSTDDIAASFGAFKGAAGRGDVSVENGLVTVRERNPGVSAASIGWDLDGLETCGCRDIDVIVDPVNAKVCEKLDLTAVRRAAERPAVKGLYLLAPEGWSGPHDGFEIISNIDDVRQRHEVMMWCTKEGYL